MIGHRCHVVPSTTATRMNRNPGGPVQKGMDLAQIQSYLQEVVIGVLLILAVVADQLRSSLCCDLTSERTSIRPCASSKGTSRGR
jgi:hypothetical protein